MHFEAPTRETAAEADIELFNKRIILYVKRTQHKDIDDLTIYYLLFKSFTRRSTMSAATSALDFKG